MRIKVAHVVTRLDFGGAQQNTLHTVRGLDPARFDTTDMASLQAFLSLAAATVSVVERIDTLARTGEEERRRAEAYRQALALVTNDPERRYLSRRLAEVDGLQSANGAGIIVN